MTTWHPRRDGAGRLVPILKPHAPSPLAAWSAPLAVASAVPGGAVPAVLNGLALAPWADAPMTHEGWELLAAASPFDEPPFDCPAVLKPAAGALVLERDGRAWCVAPTGGFGGHEFTLAKGRTDGRSLAATALAEVFEESGLRIRLLSFLCDVARMRTYTRFFIAERLGGSPAELTWESQAAVLAPLRDLRGLLTHPGDQEVLEAYLAAAGRGRGQHLPSGCTLDKITKFWRTDMGLSLGRLEEIWEETGKDGGGVFRGNPPHLQPRRLANDDSEQVMSIPNEDGSERELYRRKHGKPWEIATWVPASVN